MAGVARCKWSCEVCSNHSTMEKPVNQKRSAHLGEPEPAFWANPFSFVFFFWYNRVLLQVTSYQELQCACAMPLMCTQLAQLGAIKNCACCVRVTLASLRRCCSPQSEEVKKLLRCWEQL